MYNTWSEGEKSVRLVLMPTTELTSFFYLPNTYGHQILCYSPSFTSAFAQSIEVLLRNISTNSVAQPVQMWVGRIMGHHEAPSDPWNHSMGWPDPRWGRRGQTGLRRPPNWWCTALVSHVSSRELIWYVAKCKYIYLYVFSRVILFPLYLAHVIIFITWH